jgi:hypothetical protein
MASMPHGCGPDDVLRRIGKPDIAGIGTRRHLGTVLAPEPTSMASSGNLAAAASGAHTVTSPNNGYGRTVLPPR